jgi:hypothetical protein
MEICSDYSILAFSGYATISNKKEKPIQYWLKKLEGTEEKLSVS